MSTAEGKRDADEFEHDVFISYAREDVDWVMPNLYQPLLGCRTESGERARIFLDVGPEGLGPGEDWTEALMTAIGEARVFMPVYSSSYFTKKMCRWELTMAWQQDPTGQLGRMSPVLIEPEAKESVPQKMSAINYVVTWRDDWFAMVCRKLGLVPEETPVELEFVDQPTDTFVNHTLTPVRVRASTPNGAPPATGSEEEVTLSATSGALTGTVSVRTEGRIATFDDLSVATVESSTRLVAEAQGCAPAESVQFAVGEEPVSADSGASEATIAIEGAEEVVVLGGGDAVATLSAGRAAVYDLAGRELGGVELGARPRLVRSSDAALGLAEWSGECHLLLADGRHLSWAGPGSGGNGGMTVPGDLALGDDRACVGFWTGAVHTLVPGEDPEEEVAHSGGVQAIALAGDLVCIADLEGRLCLYRQGSLAGEAQLEPAVHLLKAYPGFLVAIGDRKLYQVPLDALEPLKIFGEPHPLGDPAGALGGTDFPVVIDAEGRGLSFSRDLEIRAKFHTVAGAMPTSASRDGRYCAFRNPDGSRSLMRDGRIVLTHPVGAFAVEAGGECIALADEERIKILSVDAVDRRLAR